MRWPENYIGRRTNICIAAAIVGAGLAGAAGTAIAGGEAVSATTQAANTAAGVQRQALAQQAGLAAPYTQLGQSAIPQLQQLLGLQGPGGTAGSAASMQQTLQNMPGYQFALQQGLQGVQNSAAARGMLNSGNTLEALQQYGTGLANQTYQQEVGNLQNAVGTGQAAAAGQAQLSQAGAANLGNIAIGQGQTLAGIDANTVAGITGAIGNAGNQYIEYNTLQNLLGNQGGGFTLPNGQTYGQAGMDYLTQQGMIGPGSIPDLFPSG